MSNMHPSPYLHLLEPPSIQSGSTQTHPFLVPIDTSTREETFGGGCVETLYFVRPFNLYLTSVKAEDSAGAQFRAMYTPQYIGPAHAYGSVVLRKLVSSKVHPRLRMFPKQQLLALAGERGYEVPFIHDNLEQPHR